MNAACVDHMHDSAFLKDQMTKDELRAIWFASVRRGHIESLKALSTRGFNPFSIRGGQTARTMVKNWSTRLGRLESCESERQRLFKDLHSALYNAELNWMTQQRLKRAFNKWRSE